MIGIGLLGCGTVGAGVVKLLHKNMEIIARRSGEQVVLKRVLEKDKDKCRQLGLNEALIADNIEDIVNDPQIDIVVELIGGIDPAYDFIIAAMEKGKHVVSANKDLIALKGRDLFDTACDNNVDFYFEASVAGGIPIVYPLKQSLAGNEISEVIGILNGTTNYILTKMASEGRDYNEVLAEAQTLGYAEADPTSDVGGLDTARKIAILASIAFNSRVELDQVYVEGITGITASDIKYAAELGYVIKLLAVAKQNEQEKVQVRVHPAFLPYNHPLAAVNDVFNGVYVIGDAVGEIMHYGRGAGQMPTASAVAGDIIEIARNIVCDANGRIGCTCYEEKELLSIDQLYAEYYIRMTVEDRPGVLAGIAGVLGDNLVSIATVIQKTSGGEMAELILITHKVKEEYMQNALRGLKILAFMERIDNIIRLEGTNRLTD